jgi:hypothetical protein
MGKSGCVLSSTWIRLFSWINHGRSLGRSEIKPGDITHLTDTQVLRAILAAAGTRFIGEHDPQPAASPGGGPLGFPRGMWKAVFLKAFRAAMSRFW